MLITDISYTYDYDNRDYNLWVSFINEDDPCSVQHNARVDNFNCNKIKKIYELVDDDYNDIVLNNDELENLILELNQQIELSSNLVKASFILSLSETLNKSCILIRVKCLLIGISHGYCNAGARRINLDIMLDKFELERSKDLPFIIQGTLADIYDEIMASQGVTVQSPEAHKKLNVNNLITQFNNELKRLNLEQFMTDTRG